MAGRSGFSNQGGYKGYQRAGPPDSLAGSFQGPSLDTAMPKPVMEDECKTFVLECREKKGKFGKVSIWENVAAPGKTLSERAPKFRGELRIGDYVFPLNLWGDTNQAGSFTGSLARN